MHRQRRLAIDFGRRHFEIIERPPDRLLDVARIPLRFTTHVQHLNVARLKSLLQFFR